MRERTVNSSSINTSVLCAPVRVELELNSSRDKGVALHLEGLNRLPFCIENELAEGLFVSSIDGEELKCSRSTVDVPDW